MTREWTTVKIVPPMPSVLAQTRNVVASDTAERNRTVGLPGGYTFHAVIDPVRVGKNGLTFAAVRVGDHAHVEVLSGRIRRRGPDPHGEFWEFVEPSYGGAGWLVLRWPEWVVLRDALDVGSPDVRVIEVEKPTAGQAKRALAHGEKP